MNRTKQPREALPPCLVLNKNNEVRPMKKIDSWTLEALKNGEGVYCNDNTVVRIAPDGVKVVELFGNKILYINCHGNLFFTLAGWNTPTTRARLNAILNDYNIGVTSRGGVPYLCGRVFVDALKIEAGAWYKVYNYVDGSIDIAKVTRFD